jgi:hypothetical protein
MYTCAICSFATGVVQQYVVHYRSHRHLYNFRFPCRINGCINTFATYAAFRTHIYRQHDSAGKRASVSRFRDLATKLTCDLNFCGESFNGLAEFLVHLKSHLKRGDTVKCPFDKCVKQFSKNASFTAHLSRNHRFRSVESIRSCYIASSSSTENENDIMQNVNDVVDNCTLECDDSNTSVCTCDDDDDLPVHYAETVGRFYLMLQGKLLVPAKTIQKIVEEMSTIHDLGQENLMKNLQRVLASNGMTEDQSTRVIKDLSVHDLFKQLHDLKSGTLRSVHMRKKFFQSKFSYIEPVAIKLGRNSYANDVWYHYVPIKESLCILLQDSSVREQIDNPLPVEDGVLQDLADGSVCKTNVLFCENRNALRIILYQDSFEVVNPIGSAKKKHKLLAVYFTLANLYPWNRSSVDQLQLILLCRESHCKQFSKDEVFRNLVDDLKDIEQTGLKCDDTYIKGSVICISGDNLGSHYIGGFVENFASTSHFCRYCLIT